MSPADLPLYMQTRITVDAAGCWKWTASDDGSGYGRATMRLPGTTRRRWAAHRLAYMLLVGEVPLGLQLDHLCRVRACCNPAHLEPVTATENVRRGTAADYWRGKTHCPRGHEYDERNTGRSTKGGRVCRACARDKMRATRAAKREAQKRSLKAAA